MSDCIDAEIRDLLPEYAHGTLSADALRRVEAHIANCGLCAEEWALLRRLGVALSATPVVNVASIVAALPPSPAMRPRRVADTPAAVRERAPRRPLFAQPWLRLAAGIVLVAGIGSLAVSRSSTTALVPAPVVTVAPDSELSTSVATDLTEAELRGLLDEIDQLQAVPAEESEDVVRGLSSTSGDL